MKHMTILQTPHGFILSKHENFDPKNPSQIEVADMIPAISLTKPYGDYSGKSVLEIVEAFFKESKTETP